ncbi:putative phage terminase large subunit [Acinetobacter phage vB_AbaM-IME-AB2]|uniref:Putative phage terminase large subunit n=1 Tax=Acinetobacter phage vB_AbaM-IME-AB2 TaxID=1243183 RepID=K4NXU1_9CAUD|nr:terminase large subunit [Acinetobacter phage vB_AbaM-IME-AB2]AFV51511.1 putative phage terminase large subunit [Acinetobacter phage vB_AbaM-IME-AB2]
MQTSKPKPKPSLNPALRSFWTTKARNKILYGGRASSKSWDAAGMAIFLANRYKLRFLCVRQLQNKIEESVYSLLKIQIERFGLQDNFRILDNKIISKVTGSEFLFYGLWRHITEIKSIESIDILWSEESHALTEAQWEVLEPTIRKEGSECWIIFNPNLVSDFVWQNFVVDPPANTLIRHINYNENPFLSQTALDVIADKKRRDPEGFAHIYDGMPRADDDMSIIKASWVEAALDAHKLLNLDDTGRSYLGFDVADAGKDKCALVHRKGIVAYWSDEWKAREDELLKSATRTYNEAIRLNALIHYDSTGVGAGVGAKVNELNKEKKTNVQHSKFVAGGGVHEPDKFYQPKITNKDFFANAKAQAWWLVADKFRLTYQVIQAIKNGTEIPKHRPEDLISISSDMPNLHRLKVELSIPHRDEDRLGRVMVESKQDLAKRDVKSPNLADAFIMAYAPVKRSMNLNSSALQDAYSSLGIRNV